MSAVTLTNYQQLAQAQGQEIEKANTAAYKARVDHELEEIRKNHQKWAAKFAQAEDVRRKEEDNWRKFYKKVYEEENSWIKDTAFYILNGIQLWALVQQYNQQKQIADRVYDLANRQQTLAEDLYSHYKAQYQPHEIQLGKQIDNYFANPYRPQYDTTAGRFVINARAQMVGKRREVLMCANQYCTGSVKTALRDLAVKEANLVGNAINSAVKYENLREQRLEDKWLQVRLSFINTGRGVSGQASTGIDGAVAAFSKFGADPGAALSQLLGTAAYTIGGIIPSPNSQRAAPIVEATPAYTRGTPTTPRSVSSVLKG